MAEDSTNLGRVDSATGDDRHMSSVLTEEQKESCRIMFEKVSDYLKGELTGIIVWPDSHDTTSVTWLVLL